MGKKKQKIEREKEYREAGIEKTTTTTKKMEGKKKTTKRRIRHLKEVNKVSPDEA